MSKSTLCQPLLNHSSSLHVHFTSECILYCLRPQCGWRDWTTASHTNTSGSTPFRQAAGQSKGCTNRNMNALFLSLHSIPEISWWSRNWRWWQLKLQEPTRCEGDGRRKRLVNTAFSGWTQGMQVHALCSAYTFLALISAQGTHAAFIFVMSKTEVFQTTNIPSL